MLFLISAEKKPGRRNCAHRNKVVFVPSSLPMLSLTVSHYFTHFIVFLPISNAAILISDVTFCFHYVISHSYPEV